MSKPIYTELDRLGDSRSQRWGARITNFLLHTREGNGIAESLAAYLGNGANGVSYHYTLADRIVCDVVAAPLFAKLAELHWENGPLGYPITVSTELPVRLAGPRRAAARGRRGVPAVRQGADLLGRSPRHHRPTGRGRSRPPPLGPRGLEVLAQIRARADRGRRIGRRLNASPGASGGSEVGRTRHGACRIRDSTGRQQDRRPSGT